MTIWTSVLERFEQQAPASVMARVALEHALPRYVDAAVAREHVATARVLAEARRP